MNLKWFEKGVASLSLSSYCHRGSQLCSEVPVIIPVGSACQLISSAARKIASSERGDTQVTAEQPVSTQSKEWVYEIGGKRGNQSSGQSHELLPVSFERTMQLCRSFF